MQAFIWHLRPGLHAAGKIAIFLCVCEKYLGKYTCRCRCTTQQLSFEWSHLGVIYFLCSENQLLQQTVPKERIGYNLLHATTCMFISRCMVVFS